MLIFLERGAITAIKVRGKEDHKMFYEPRNGFPIQRDPRPLSREFATFIDFRTQGAEMSPFEVASKNKLSALFVAFLRLEVA